MDSRNTNPSKSPYITSLESFRSQNVPTDSADEAEFGTFVLPFAILSFLPLRSKANILLAKKSLNIASLLCIRVCDSLTDSQPRNRKLYRATISKRRSPSKSAPIGCAPRATLMIEIWTHFQAPSSSKLFDAYLPLGFKQVRICSP